jgi:hypothetical protein
MLLTSTTTSTKVEIKTKNFGDEKKLVIQTIKPFHTQPKQHKKYTGRKLNDDSESADQDEDEPSTEIENNIEKVTEESEQEPVDIHRPNFEEAGRLVFT